MIIMFCGHADYDDTIDKIAVVNLVEKIAKGDRVEFYLGGYGKFDQFAYECAVLYKKYHFETKIVFVTPYIYENYSKLAINKDRYDEIIYPELESVPPKFAILKRNEWMVDRAEIVFAYVKRNFGGANQTLQYAKRRKKKIVDLYNENLTVFQN